MVVPVPMALVAVVLEMQDIDRNVCMGTWYRLDGDMTVSSLATVLELHTGTWHYLVSRDKP